MRGSVRLDQRWSTSSRFCSESFPPARGNIYSARQQMIPQSKPPPRTITRAIRFGNEAGAISIDKISWLASKPYSSLFPQESPRRGVLIKGLATAPQGEFTRKPAPAQLVG